jgi:hypothetical protein
MYAVGLTAARQTAASANFDERREKTIEINVQSTGVANV